MPSPVKRGKALYEELSDIRQRIKLTEDSLRISGAEANGPCNTAKTPFEAVHECLNIVDTCLNTFVKLLPARNKKRAELLESDIKKFLIEISEDLMTASNVYSLLCDVVYPKIKRFQLLFDEYTEA